MSKFEIAITTLMIGFILGQATDIIKYQLSIYRKKKALKEEVQDHLNRMHYLKSRLCGIAEDFLDPQVIGLPVPGKIKPFVFSAHFPEISQHYSALERQLIIEHYGTIDSFNNGVDELSNPQQNLVGKKILNLYHYCCLLTETSRCYLNGKVANSVKDNEAALLSIQKSVEDFAKKYNLLASNESS